MRRPRRESAVSRSVIMGLDHIERLISLIAGFVAVAMALALPFLIGKLYTITAKPISAKKCAVGYKLVGNLCQLTRPTVVSDWILRFVMILVIGLLLVMFALLRKRVGVAFVGLFLGLAIGTIGLPFLMLGGWLVIRALRLQKYGDATFAGSSMRAREMAKAKKEGRALAPSTAKSAKSAKGAKNTAPSAPKPPSASKRYTPKQRTRRR
jgi:hypothetical protein